MAKQLQKLRLDGLYGQPNFISWIRDHVSLVYIVILPCIFVVICNTIRFHDGQFGMVVGVHPDLHQLSIGRVILKSYGRYDVNGYRFRTTKFEATHPLAATKNSRVVIRATDVEGHETDYYGSINKILECEFAENKEMRCFSSVHSLTRSTIEPNLE